MCYLVHVMKWKSEIHAYFLRFCRTSSGYEFAEQVQDMNLQPKVVRMAEMEELRVEVFLFCFLITDPLLF